MAKADELQECTRFGMRSICLVNRFNSKQTMYTQVEGRVIPVRSTGSTHLSLLPWLSTNFQAPGTYFGISVVTE